MESVHFVTILVKSDVLVASFSDEVRDDDKKKVILKLCQHVIMYNSRIVHVVFEHNTLPLTIQWFRQIGFLDGYQDRDYYSLKIGAEVLVKKYIKGILMSGYQDDEMPGVWRARL
jgi:hypothetical protein